MANWQLQDAKQRFSELVRTTIDEGPQVVTRNGEEVVVVVPVGEWRASHPRRDLLDAIMDSPPFDDLAPLLERDRSLPRDIDL